MEFTEKVKVYQHIAEQYLGSRAAVQVWHGLRAQLLSPRFPSGLGSAGKELTLAFPFLPPNVTW